MPDEESLKTTPAAVPSEVLGAPPSAFSFTQLQIGGYPIQLFGWNKLLYDSMSFAEQTIKGFIWNWVIHITGKHLYHATAMVVIKTLIQNQLSQSNPLSYIWIDD